MYLSANLADGQALEFEMRGDDAVLGLCRFSVAVPTIDGHTIKIQRWSPAAEAWHDTGDALTAVGLHVAQSTVATRFRLLAVGGTGSALVEVES